MKSLDIFSDDEVAEYILERKERIQKHDFIEKPIYQKYKHLIEQNIRPEREPAPVPYPPFRYHLEKEADPYMCLPDVNEQDWREYKKKMKLVYRALHENDELVPPWEAPDPLEVISYFLAFHVYDEFNSHPKIIEMMRTGGHIHRYPQYGVPPMINQSLDNPYWPWDTSVRIMSNLARPYLDKFMETLTPHSREHGWLIRYVFLLEPELYKLTPPLHEELRTALPPDKLDGFFNTFNGMLQLKRWVTGDLTIFKEQYKPGSFEYEFERWMNHERDTFPEYGIDYTFSHSARELQCRGGYDTDEDDDDDKPSKKKASKKAQSKTSTPTKPNNDALF